MRTLYGALAPTTVDASGSPTGAEPPNRRTIMFRTSLLALCFSLLIAGTAAAQQMLQPVRSGDQVRIRAGTISGEFTVVGYGEREMMLQAAPTEPVVEVPFASVTRLHVNRGARSSGAGLVRGAGRGLLIGGGIGAVTGFASGDDTGSFFVFTAEDKAMILGVLLGGAGAVVGGLVGAVSPGDRWERVDNRTRLHVAPRNDGGVAVALTRRF